MTLADYLQTNELTDTAFAARLGVQQSTIHRIKKCGQIPSPVLMAAIFAETNGLVRPDDFYGVAA